MKSKDIFDASIIGKNFNNFNKSIKNSMRSIVKLKNYWETLDMGLQRNVTFSKSESFQISPSLPPFLMC